MAECCICSESMQGVRMVSGNRAILSRTSETRVLKCGHLFHHDCVKRWILEGNLEGAAPSCPMCRSTIRMPGESFYMSILLVRRQEKIQAHHDQVAMEYFQRQFEQSEDSDDDTYSYSDDSDYSTSDDDSTEEDDDVWQKHIRYIQYIHEAIKMEWMARAWFTRLEKKSKKRFKYIINLN